MADILEYMDDMLEYMTDILEYMDDMLGYMADILEYMDDMLEYMADILEYMDERFGSRLYAFKNQQRVKVASEYRIYGQSFHADGEKRLLVFFHKKSFTTI
jgi:uncharacterized protein with HEPN domain